MIVREDHDDIAVVRLARSPVNAIDLGFCEAATTAIRDVAASSARALVVTGTGSTFSAGVDLRAAQQGGEYLRRFLPAMDALFRAFLTFPKPMVAAVNGHAIAGGCILAASCDSVLMSDGKGKIGVPELAVGVPFPVLPFEIIRARVSAAMFRRLVLQAALLQPKEALGAGLVDAVTEPMSLIEDAVTVAGDLARIPPATFALTKRAFVDPIRRRVAAAATLDADIGAAWQSDEVQEALAAYVQRTLNRS